VDGVVVATPNHTHKDVALRCIEAGIPCLVEKPLATTAADGQMVVSAAERRGVTVAVGYSTRFRNEVETLRDLLLKGFFGRVQRFLYQSGSAGGWSPVSGYNLDREATGGGVLVVTGAHFLDRMLYWFGYPDSVELTDDSEGGPESHCVGRVHYRSALGDFSGIIRLSKVVPLFPGFAMETERGLVLLPTRHPSELILRPRDPSELEMTLRNRSARRFSTRKDDLQNELEDFAIACVSGRDPLVPARQGLQSVRLIEDFYRHRRGLLETSNPPVAQETAP
jgi:predicted dehydrogenase